METILAKIKNDGWRSQVVRTPDGTVTVPLGQTVTAEILPPDGRMLAHYAERGVTITPLKAKKDRRGQIQPPREDLEKAVAEAEANLAAVKDGDDLEAIAGAQQALDEAAKALAAA